MSQYYELTSFKPSDFKDDHGNTWCDAAFLGVSEPVKWVVKDTSRAEVGKKYYGRIEDKTSKAGKPYQRFYVESQPEGNTQPGNTQSDEYWAERNDAIKAQFAIKTAVELLKNPEADVKEDTIEHWAKIFFNMVERVASKTAPEQVTKEPEINLGDEPINMEDIPF